MAAFNPSTIAFLQGQWVFSGFKEKPLKKGFPSNSSVAVYYLRQNLLILRPMDIWRVSPPLVMVATSSQVPSP
jgi:hypothetical protein